MKRKTKTVLGSRQCGRLRICFSIHPRISIDNSDTDDLVTLLFVHRLSFGKSVSWIGLDNYIKMLVMPVFELHPSHFSLCICICTCETDLWSIDCLSFNEEYQRNDFLSFFVLCA